MAFGSEINWQRNGHRECGIFGRGAVAAAEDRINCLVMGMYGGPVGGAWPGLTTDNTILIGNAAQTIVRIGAYTIGASQGTVAQVDQCMPDTGGRQVKSWRQCSEVRSRWPLREMRWPRRSDARKVQGCQR